MFTVAAEQAEAVGARVAALPVAVQAALAAKAGELAGRLQAHVVQDKLSGQVLKVRSGALRASIGSDFIIDGERVRVRVFSAGEIKYAAIQEYGGQTSAHDIVPDKAKALAFLIGGQQVFAKHVHHPGSRIPERSYLRSSLADLAAEITAGLKQAVAEKVAKS